MASPLHEDVDPKSALSGKAIRTSHEPCSRRAVKACWLPAMSSSAMRRVSSEPSDGNPVIFTGTNWPLTSIWGRPPGEKIRSLTRVEARNIAESKAGAGIAGLATTSLGTRALVGVFRIFSFGRPKLIFYARGVSSDQGCCAHALEVPRSIRGKRRRRRLTRTRGSFGLSRSKRSLVRLLWRTNEFLTGQHQKVAHLDD